MERSDKQRVLVVDDDREIVAAIVRLLEREESKRYPHTTAGKLWSGSLKTRYTLLLSTL